MEQSFSTMLDLVTAFEKLHVSQLKQPASVRCKIRKYFGPLLPLPLESLSVQTVLGWVNGIRAHSSCQADGCLTILRTMLKKAVEWDMYKGQNVAQVVKRKRAPRRKRYVRNEELPALAREIEREPLMHQVYFNVLLYMGPRPGEAEVIERTHIKIITTEAGLVGAWTKPETKNGDVQIMPIPQFLCELLRWYLTMLPTDQQYLFSLRSGRPISKEAWHVRWKEVRRRAGLLDVQLRDIRRTCATHTSKRVDLITVSKCMLNHRDLNTTQIYVQPQEDRLLEAMNANIVATRAHLQPQGGHHATSRQNHHLPQSLPSGLPGGDNLPHSDSSSPDYGHGA